MSKRVATPEQKEIAAAKRERFRQLAKTVAAMSEDERTALLMRAGAVLTCEGRALSNVNTMTLLMQRPGVSVVGGFWQWKKAGRKVRKGETGLSIWIPKLGKADGTAAADLGEVVADGATSGPDKKAGGGSRFIIGTVFDVSQTDPEDDKGGMPSATEANCNASTGC